MDSAEAEEVVAVAVAVAFVEEVTPRGGTVEVEVSLEVVVAVLGAEGDGRKMSCSLFSALIL